MIEPHLKLLVADILRELKGYHDNFVIVDMVGYFYENGEKKRYDLRGRRTALDILIDKQLVGVEGKGRWRIAINNRYKLEKLARELGVVNDALPNLVYYDIETGSGFINGKSVTLKKTNKKLFDLLFNNANSFVSRKVIWKAMGNRTNPKQNDTDSHDLNEKISNLRKVCKTDASVIAVNDGVILKAEAYVYKNNRVEYREITSRPL